MCRLLVRSCSIGRGRGDVQVRHTVALIAVESMVYDTIHDVIFGVAWVPRATSIVGSRFGGRCWLFFVDDRHLLWTRFNSWVIFGGRTLLWIVGRYRNGRIRIRLNRDGLQ